MTDRQSVDDSTAGWVIVDPQTGKSVTETWSRKIAMSAQKTGYQAIPVALYIARLSQRRLK